MRFIWLQRGACGLCTPVWELVRVQCHDHATPCHSPGAASVEYNSILKMTGRVKRRASGCSCQQERDICVGNPITGVSSSLLRG